VASTIGCHVKSVRSAIDALETVVDATAADDVRETALLRVIDGGQADGLALIDTLRAAAREAAVEGPRRVDVPPVSAAARWRALLTRRVVPIAAAAAVLIMARQWAMAPSGETASRVERGGDSSLSLTAPASGAPLAERTDFTWQPIVDATSYIITWRDRDGAVVASDTVAAPPARLPQIDAATRQRITLWQVEATTKDGRRLPSPLRPVAVP
jgi:hypothetical protein